MFIAYYFGVLICWMVLCHAAVLRKTDELDDELSAFRNKFVRNKTTAEIEQEKGKDFWRASAIKALNDRLHQKLNLNPAKNVILFLGDGMSIPTIAATRVYLGGEEMHLSFENFPYTGISKTYCVDHQTADSACSATAFLGGVKANLGTVGVTAAVEKKNCTAMNLPENQVDSVAKWFQECGKRTGFVTTTRVTHATPSALYAHSAERHWEVDTDVINDGRNSSICSDIAYQLVFGGTGRKLDVIMGGGRQLFLPMEWTDEEGFAGKRSDKLNLIDEWMNQRQGLGAKFEYAWNRAQLLNVSNDTQYLLGLFEPQHMQYNLMRNIETDPSLEEMTEAAIKVLNKGDSGFFLLVEGGRIDTAHHSSWAHKALDETAEFSKAIAKAVELTNEEDTLIVVTSDHAHTMSYAGYAARGSDVFGYAGTASDDKYYSILNYANGPGYKPMSDLGDRYVPSEEEMNDVHFSFPSTTPMKSETHGADDVPIYARGPWAHLFTGVMEENVIPYLMAYAACLSRGAECGSYLKKLRV
ncbi:alkaline phosphatase-like [Cylas formicarius]|uniref:alkaline phosphatase-like n=1 Tax=Cylas formicarius TaxID=197179 RepID=UPI0029584F86|nr:alkaline phosphatase-like [Cylas formicarius]